jgi:hypothetical protein
MAIPGRRLTRRLLGTVTWTTELGASMSFQSSAAVWWLNIAPGPAYKMAAHNVAARLGSPENVAYTPGCNRRQRPRLNRESRMPLVRPACTICDDERTPH